MNGENNLGQNQNTSGSLVGSVIVVIILIIGAIYLFSTRTDAPVLSPGGENAVGETTTGESLQLEADSAVQESVQLDSQINELNAEAGF